VTSHRLDRFTLDDLLACREAIAAAAEGADAMEEVATAIARHLHEVIVGGDGMRALPLVRLYKTHRFGDLDEQLQVAAESSTPELLGDATRCLVLLGTAGVEPTWNDRHRSMDHRAIPLVSELVVERSPMIASLIRQLGLDLATVVRPDENENIARHHLEYGVFHVPEAVGSPLVPAQSGFVERYGIRSVVGCGGVLPSGDFFALVAFSTTTITAEVADLFRSLAFSVKAALIPHTYRVFSDA
jgi:hypothetical protein